MSEAVFNGETYKTIIDYRDYRSCASCDLNNKPECDTAYQDYQECKNIIWKLKPKDEIKEELDSIETEAYIAAINKKYSEDEPIKYKHYFKDVSHLETADVYRIIDLWEVSHPCLQHALKKILVAGNRGHKDIEKDIQEAIDSLNRWKEMQVEDKYFNSKQGKDNL